MNYDLRLQLKGIKRIHYFGNPIISSLVYAILPTFIFALLYKYILRKNILFLQEKSDFYRVIIAFVYLIFIVIMYKRRRYIQWDERNIIFKNINGYTATIGVDKIKSIKIDKNVGIYITHENFIDKKKNGTYLIPFDNLGRNYNVDVDIIINDFKKLYTNLIK